MRGSKDPVAVLIRHHIVPMPMLDDVTCHVSREIRITAGHFCPVLKRKVLRLLDHGRSPTLSLE